MFFGLCGCYAMATAQATKYDDAGRLVNAIYSNGQGLTYTYDKAGNIANVAQITFTAVTTQPQSQTVAAGGGLTLTVAAAGVSTPALQWQRDGSDLTGATTSTFTIGDVEPIDAGIYTVTATSNGVAIASSAAIVGVTTAQKVIGTGQVVGSNIVHPNGNIFDQVLLTGTAEAITADAGQVTRTSYIDLNNNIVQVEFSGPGTLSLVLDNWSGPALPVNYNQAVSYMKGHAGIVITGANEFTNVLVFTVGRATALDPTGGFNILLPVSAANSPAHNGSPLFQGHASTTYGGVADISFIAIESTDGKFGGVRTADANYFAASGVTGLYAPGVQFMGPVYIGNISAFDSATPVIILGSASSNTWITGGDLLQGNGRPVQVSGLTQLKFAIGSDSAGNILPAKANHAILLQNGTDVTNQVVVNPSQ